MRPPKGEINLESCCFRSVMWMSCDLMLKFCDQQPNLVYASLPLTTTFLIGIIGLLGCCSFNYTVFGWVIYYDWPQYCFWHLFLHCSLSWPSPSCLDQHHGVSLFHYLCSLLLFMFLLSSIPGCASLLSPSSIYSCPPLSAMSPLSFSHLSIF